MPYDHPSAFTSSGRAISAATSPANKSKYSSSGSWCCTAQLRPSKSATTTPILSKGWGESACLSRCCSSLKRMIFKKLLGEVSRHSPWPCWGLTSEAHERCAISYATVILLMFAIIAQHNTQNKILQQQCRNLKDNRSCRLPYNAMTDLRIENSTWSVLSIVSIKCTSNIDYSVSNTRKLCLQFFPILCLATHGNDGWNGIIYIQSCWGTRHDAPSNLTHSHSLN